MRSRNGQPTESLRPHPAAIASRWLAYGLDVGRVDVKLQCSVREAEEHIPDLGRPADDRHPFILRQPPESPAMAIGP